MLTLLGRSDSVRTHCDRLSRRSFLKIGGMAAGGLSLSQLLALDARAGHGRSHKAVINVFLSAMAAYAFSRFRFKGRRLGLLSLLLVQVFPQFLHVAERPCALGGRPCGVPLFEGFT